MRRGQGRGPPPPAPGTPPPPAQPCLPAGGRLLINSDKINSGRSTAQRRAGGTVVWLRLGQQEEQNGDFPKTRGGPAKSRGVLNLVPGGSRLRLLSRGTSEAQHLSEMSPKPNRPSRATSSLSPDSKELTRKSGGATHTARVPIASPPLQVPSTQEVVRASGVAI